jgi:hypothetical protein
MILHQIPETPGCNSTSLRGITFTHKKIGMRNNENPFGTKKTKDPKQDNQTKVQSHIQHRPVDRNFQRGFMIHVLLTNFLLSILW